MRYLLDALNEYQNGGVYPMHMPGHKRNPEFWSMGDPYALDITEIDGFDDLNDAHGLLKEGMARAARLYGSDRAYYLINGSTAGILAGVLACTRRGDAMLVARNCHKSVYHALELQELRPQYLFPEFDAPFGISGSIAPEAVRRALNQSKDIKLVVITSPSYEGITSDIRAIAQIAHERNVPLMVDGAHGAHLGFSSEFPQSPIRAGADIVVNSLHKTLPALTQTALLHVSGALVDAEEIARRLQMVQTSSPSYPLMASIDQCVRLLSERGGELFSAYASRLRQFDARIKTLKKLRVFGYGLDDAARHPAAYAFDRSKLVISTNGTNLTGPELMQRLRARYKIELEMASGDYAIAMTGICDTDQGFDRLADALEQIDTGAERVAFVPAQSADIGEVQIAMSIRDALCAEGERLPLCAAVGCVSREYAYAYPPGIPLLVPGELIAPEIVRRILALEARGVRVRYGSDRVDGMIDAVKSRGAHPPRLTNRAHVW